MAQLLLQGTNFVNFVGFNAWVGEERRVTAVQVTEWDEPQAVIGSYLHRYAYPDWYAAAPEARHAAARGARRTHARPARCLQLRGEYLYVAEGPGGIARLRRGEHRQQGRLADASSPRRSRRSARTRTSRSTNATCVALPTNQPINPLRNEGDLMRVDNQEQPFHPIYNYAVITDAEKG